MATALLAADHGKFKRNAMMRLGDLTGIDAVSTDRSGGGPMTALFAARKPTSTWRRKWRKTLMSKERFHLEPNDY